MILSLMKNVYFYPMNTSHAQKQKSPEGRSATKEVHKSPEEWREIWLKKLDKKLIEQEIEKSISNRYRNIIADFLTWNPGAPAYIHKDKIELFLKKQGLPLLNQSCDALQFFYHNVANSQKHCDVITNTQKSLWQKHNTEVRHWVRQLENEIQLRHYSIRTAENYKNAVKAFLEKKFIDLHNINEEDVKSYILSLDNIHKLSAATINLHISGLKFFFTHVIKRPELFTTYLT